MCDIGQVITIVQEIYRLTENVKVQKQRCRNLNYQCVLLLLTLQEGTTGLEDNRIVDFANELEAIVLRIRAKVQHWASLNRFQSFLAAGDIQTSVETLQRELDDAQHRFQIRVNLAESTTRRHEMQTIHHQLAGILDRLDELGNKQSNPQLNLPVLEVQPFMESPLHEQIISSPSIPTRDSDSGYGSLTSPLSLPPATRSSSNPEQLLHGCHSIDDLIDRIVNNYNSQYEPRWLDIVLLICADFTTPEGLLQRLVGYYDNDTLLNSESRTAVKLIVLIVMKYWVSSGMFCARRILSDIGLFVSRISNNPQSETVVRRIAEVQRALKTSNEANLPFPSSPTRPPSIVSAQMARVSPGEYAVGLTMLEWSLHQKLDTSEYIAYFRQGDTIESSTVYSRLRSISRKIMLWVQRNILQSEDLQLRVAIMSRFISMAEECRQLCNYSSMAAITLALQSIPIAQLEHTNDQLPASAKALRQRLFKIVDRGRPPTGRKGAGELVGYPAYRKELVTLRKGSGKARGCIPWLNVHIIDLMVICDQYPKHTHGSQTINVERYYKLIDYCRDHLSPTPSPSLSFNQLFSTIGIPNDLFEHISRHVHAIQPRANDKEELLAASNRLIAMDAAASKAPAGLRCRQPVRTPSGPSPLSSPTSPVNTAGFHPSL